MDRTEEQTHLLRRSPQQVRRAIAASIVGNALEWFDFALYGYFIAIIAKTFFPAADPVASMLLAAATFAISFVVRPLGGILFGAYADRVGRKPALTLIILMMGAATLLIGVTPSYETIGIAAPLIVVFARVLQGLAVGGEFASATALLAEYAPPHRKMLFGSLQMCSQALSLTLETLLAFGLAIWLTQTQLESWGWRIAFIAGALIALIGFYIRRYVDESPEFVQAQAQRTTARMPLIETLRNHWPALVAGFGVVVVGTVSFYGWFIYLPLFVVEQLKLDFSAAMFATFVSGLMLLVLCPIAGVLCDRFGGARIFTLGVIAFGALAYPLIAYVVDAPSIDRLLVAQTTCTLAIGFVWGATPGLLASLFPVGIRSTGMSISYNVGVLVFGGLAPLTLTYFVSTTGDDMVPAYYIIVSATIALTLLWGTKAARARRSSLVTT